MKFILNILALLTMGIYSCNSRHGKTQISDIETRELSTFIYKINDTTDILYSRVKLGKFQISYSAKTDLRMFSEADRIEDLPIILDTLKNKDFILMINHNIITCNKHFRDIKQLVPTNLVSFKFNNKGYMMVQMELVSFINVSESLTLLNETDGNINACNTLLTKNPISIEDIGDFNHDGRLDYRLKSGNENYSILEFEH